MASLVPVATTVMTVSNNSNQSAAAAQGAASVISPPAMQGVVQSWNTTIDQLQQRLQLEKPEDFVANSLSSMTIASGDSGAAQQALVSSAVAVKELVESWSTAVDELNKRLVLVSGEHQSVMQALEVHDRKQRSLKLIQQVPSEASKQKITELTQVRDLLRQRVVEEQQATQAALTSTREELVTNLKEYEKDHLARMAGLEQLVAADEAAFNADLQAQINAKKVAFYAGSIAPELTRIASQRAEIIGKLTAAGAKADQLNQTFTGLKDRVVQGLITYFKQMMKTNAYPVTPYDLSTNGSFKLSFYFFLNSAYPHVIQGLGINQHDVARLYNSGPETGIKW